MGNKSPDNEVSPEEEGKMGRVLRLNLLHPSVNGE